MKQLRTGMITAVIILALAAAPALSQDAGQKAPDFTLKDLSGKNFRLSDQKGKVVLLVFTATWCPYCRTAIPYLKDLHATYGKKGLVIAGVDIEESAQKVGALADKYDIPYTMLLDTDGSVARRYHVVGIPNFTLIDREGVVVCRQCSAVDRLLQSLFK